MPVLRKIVLSAKAGAERGTKSQEAVVELAKNEWDNIQAKYQAMEPEE